MRFRENTAEAKKERWNRYASNRFDRVVARIRYLHSLKSMDEPSEDKMLGWFFEYARWLYYQDGIRLTDEEIRMRNDIGPAWDVGEE